MDPVVLGCVVFFFLMVLGLVLWDHWAARYRRRTELPRPRTLESLLSAHPITKEPNDEARRGSL